MADRPTLYLERTSSILWDLMIVGMCRCPVFGWCFDICGRMSLAESPGPSRNTSPTTSRSALISARGYSDDKYPVLTQLKRDIKTRFISSTDINKKFLPANALRDLVTRDNVLSAFRETGRIEEGELDRLTQSVLEGRQRLFLILVLMTWPDKERLSSLKDQEWDSISDDSLPFTECDDKFFFNNADGDESQCLTPNRWCDNEYTLFDALQWPLVTPVFGSADSFVHRLTESHILPYLEISAGPKSSGFFSEVWRAEIHVAHIDTRHIPAESARANNDTKSVTVAIKTARDAKELIEFFDKEAQNLERVQRIESEHIIKPIAAYQKGNARCLLFPWAHGGNLATYWEKQNEIRSELGNLQWIMKQLVGICSALVVLHKDANNGHEEGCLKIADMGLSTFHDEEANTKQRNRDGVMTKTPSGTFRYEPPEMDRNRASGKPRSRQYDIWSMGCIMIDLLVWLLYGYEAVMSFRQATTQFWERTSPAKYYISSYVDACMDIMENDLEGKVVYRSLLELVRGRVLIVDVSAEYKSSPSHREIASELYAKMDKIRQEPSSSYMIPNGLKYPHAEIEKRKQHYFRPHSEGGRLAVEDPIAPARTTTNSQDQPTVPITSSGGFKMTVRAPTVPTDPHLGIPEPTDKQEEPTRLEDVWESIPDNNFARSLFKSLPWDVIKPPATPSRAFLCANCNIINSADLFKSVINRDELEISSQFCALCRLLQDALKTQGKGLPTVISLRQNGSVVGINNGPNLLSIYVDPGPDIFKGAQLGLPKLPDHGSLEQFLLLKEWIRVCDFTHRTCREDAKPAPTMPTRLVEVGDPLRLVKSRCIKPSPYVALSHCWGKTETLCTTNENITQLMESINFSSLPKTFRDAIQVTRGIGIEYLWIDSLCIIQDDKNDWEHESAQMEKVFSFAYCTIGASSSKSSVEGFLDKRCSRSCVQLETTGIGTLYVCQNIDNFHLDVELGELNSRGWVLQERALSRRSIFYTRTQVYWECGAGVHCETLARLKNAKAALIGDAKFPNSALEYYRDGRQMLVQDLYERYSRLAFTHYWDRPVAILGLQERLARAFKTQGAYGLFATYAGRLLLWKRSGVHHMTRIQQHSGAHRRAPTWSWFSKMGAIKYLELKFQEIDWATTRDFINPFKSPPSSKLADTIGVDMTLKGQARKLKLPMIELVRYTILDENKDEDADVDELRCVVIGRDKAWNNLGDMKFHALIIRGVKNGAEGDIQDKHEAIEEDSVLEGLAALPYHERLTKFISGSTKHWVADGVTIVDFRPLYAVTIHHLQHRLAAELAKIEKTVATDEQLESIRDILHKYSKTPLRLKKLTGRISEQHIANSLRDFEFIHTNRWNTQFVKDIAASRLDNGKGSRLLAALLAEHGLQVSESHRSLFKDLDLLGSFDDELMRQSNAIGRSLGTERTYLVANQERLKQTRTAIRRFSFAIIGGLIIIVPLLVLLVGEELSASLAVISTSILFFAIIAASFTKLEPENLLASTAAYAAVLVGIIGNRIKSSITYDG
ncbi:hypothetical protein FHL15_009736 [Xylaria flabelliformis]|uniref:Protein kinase domain-containing protein n=1 Tax=Xylaria flabelliformis TaxID=2512241 RepID=A0A553HMW5_9PEZI|nr:hypothetical protein FHL15_009736 [Xylaria flabelliformis]